MPGAIVVLLVAFALAGADDRATLVLDDVLDEATANNPALAEARGRWEAARAAVGFAAAPPNPTIGLGYGMIPSDEFGFGNAAVRALSLSQRIPFPGKLYSSHKVASHMSAMAAEMYAAKERDIVADVTGAYYDLYVVHESTRITEEARDYLAAFARIAETKYAVGKGSLGDVLKAQVELAGVENDLLTLQQELTTQEARMNALLNRPFARPVGRPEPPPLEVVALTPEQIDSIALDSRPQLRAARELSRAAAAAHSVSKMDYFPDLMLTLKREDREASNDTWEVMFSAELPVWLLFKENRKLEETEAKLASARAAARDAENTTLLAVRTAFIRYDTARRTIELYQTSILPQAELSRESARIAYENDTRDFLSLLDSERSLLRFTLEYAKAQSDYEKSLAELERAAGRELPREPRGSR
jgi:cobalt-zinc-cadmium efflux system outer membrane protein